MKFYLKQIIITTSGVVADEQKFAFNKEADAIKKFHLVMGANMNEPTIAECTLMIVVDDGEHSLYVSKSETFRREIKAE